MRLLFILILGIAQTCFAETTYRSGRSSLPKVLVLIIVDEDEHLRSTEEIYLQTTFREMFYGVAL
jgi:hypothetical protein